jgi:hypothetical protein
MAADNPGAVHLAPNPDLFYGFYMNFVGGQQKLSGFIANCR